MTEGTIGIIVVLCIVLAAIAGAVWGYLSYKHHQEKLLEYYRNIQIGDRYYLTVGPLHPFDTTETTHTCKIINKTLAGDKHPWVQYQYDSGAISQAELHEFLADHKKESNK